MTPIGEDFTYMILLMKSIIPFFFRPIHILSSIVIKGVRTKWSVF